MSSGTARDDRQRRRHRATPLTGLTVVDMGQVLATPFVTYLPAGKVRSLVEVTTEGHPTACGVLQPVDSPAAEGNAERPGPTDFPPPVGTHTRDVLAD